LLSIALGLLADVTITLSFTLEPKLIIGLVVRSVSRARGGCLNCKEACVVELYIYYFSEYTYILNRGIVLIYFTMRQFSLRISPFRCAYTGGASR
jgi:hypothetical protein